MEGTLTTSPGSPWSPLGPCGPCLPYMDWLNCDVTIYSNYLLYLLLVQYYQPLLHHQVFPNMVVSLTDHVSIT